MLRIGIEVKGRKFGARDRQGREAEMEKRGRSEEIEKKR